MKKKERKKEARYSILNSVKVDGYNTRALSAGIFEKKKGE